MTAPLQNTYAFSEEAYVFLKKGVRVFLGGRNKFDGD